MAPSAPKQPVAAIDDPAHLRRFMEEMKKKRPTTFISSGSQSMQSTTSDEAVLPGTEVAKDEVDGLISRTENPVLPDRDIPSDVQNHNTDNLVPLPSPEGIRGNTSVLPVRPKDNGIALSEPISNKFLQSPHLSGLKAPPPTPESGPHSSPAEMEEIKAIIEMSVGRYLDGKTSLDGLAQSRHAPAPSPSSSPSRTKGILLNADGQPRFKSPYRELSPESRRERNAAFDRTSFTIADAPISAFLSRSEKAAHANYLATLEDQSGEDDVTKVMDHKESVSTTVKDEMQWSTNGKAQAKLPPVRLGSYSSVAGKHTSDTKAPEQGSRPVSSSSNNQHSPKQVQKGAQHDSIPESLTGSIGANSVSSMNETAIAVPRSNGWIPPHLRLPDSVSTKLRASEDSEKTSDPIQHKPSSTEDVKKTTASKQITGSQHDETSSSENVSKPTPHASTNQDIPQPSGLTAASSQADLPKDSYATSSKDTVSQSSSDQHSINEDIISQTSDDTSKLPPHLRCMISHPNTVSGTSTKKTVSRTSATSVATNHKPSPISVGKGDSSSALGVKFPHSGISLEEPTPSSVEFQNVAPNTVGTTSGIKAADAGTASSVNLENAVFLGAWPKRDDREAPAARVRKVIITGLPSDPTATFVASLVYGGPLENISVGKSSAFVLFLHAQDCLKYYNATKNGVVYGKDGKKELFAFVELGKDVDVIGGKLQSLIEQKATRCVKVNGADTKFTTAELVKLANSKHRRLEGIEDRKAVGPNGKERREITFRFCCIQDAVTFAAFLRREEAWEESGIFHSPDPCAEATGVHLD